MGAEAAAIALLRKDAEPDNKFGAWRGKIESIDDPDRLGRARVRVWGVHGDEYRTPTNALPWADVAEHAGGGYDFGPFNPPPVGAAVWCMFEGGLEDFPVIFGTYRGIPERNAENPNVFLTKDGQPRAETAWTPPDGDIETPKDVFDGVHNGDPHPTRRVWHKSYKGFTMMIEEADGHEYMKIIDRAGQLIMFDCPVEEEFGKGNQAQRGVRDAHRGDQMAHSALVNRRASIRIRDLSGQELVLDAKDQAECITLRGRARDGSSTNTIRIFSGKGKDYIELIDTNGDKLKFDPHNPESIRLEDSAGSFISFNREDGTICINGAKESQVCAKKEIKNISGTSTSDIAGDENKTVKGNKNTNILNDATVGVLGNTSGILGGVLKLIITNSSPSGPEEFPLDIQIASGKGRIKVLFGDAVFEGGPNTLIGSDSADENFLCGKLWTTWILPLLNALVNHTHGNAVGGSSPPIVGLQEFIDALNTITAGAADDANPLSRTVFTTKEKTVVTP